MFIYLKQKRNKHYEMTLCLPPIICLIVMDPPRIHMRQFAGKEGDFIANGFTK